MKVGPFSILYADHILMFMFFQHMKVSITRMAPRELSFPSDDLLAIPDPRSISTTPLQTRTMNMEIHKNGCLYLAVQALIRRVPYPC